MTEKKKSNKGWIIVLSILFALAMGLNFWQWNTGSKVQSVTNEDLVAQATAEADSIIASLRLENDLAIGHIDSLEQELSYWKTELEAVRNQSSSGSLNDAERNRLLGRIAQLRQRIANFAFKEQLLDSMTQKNLSYELLVAQKEDSLAQVLISLDTLKQNVNELNNLNDDLNQTISNAGQPRYSPLVVYGRDEKRSGTQNTFDASKIEEFFVEFKIIGSTLFKKTENIEVKVRVLGPEGELYQKGGSKIEKPRSQDFTFYETFDYTGQNKSFKLSFKPSKKLPKGEYACELMVNGKSIQSKRITLH